MFIFYLHYTFTLPYIIYTHCLSVRIFQEIKPSSNIKISLLLTLIFTSTGDDILICYSLDVTPHATAHHVHICIIACICFIQPCMCVRSAGDVLQPLHDPHATARSAGDVLQPLHDPYHHMLQPCMYVRSSGDVLQPLHDPYATAMYVCTVSSRGWREPHPGVHTRVMSSAATEPILSGKPVTPMPLFRSAMLAG